ncbi:MAG: hypothetical protein ABJG68_01555 [Crocinitomicaceae bacterium]
MAECINCGEYTKFNGGLCFSCYKKEGKSKDVQVKEKSEKKKVAKKADSKSNGKSNSWVYNLIKGRIAETIVEELFLSLDFQVYKYGMENTIPGIMDLLKGVKDEVAMEIKRMPDLVVYKDGRAHFIEVKFRASGSFKLSDIDKKGDYPYQNALIVLVSKRHIKSISFMELADGKEIHENDRKYLGSRKEFDTDKEKIIEYCQYAVKFFENV